MRILVCNWKDLRHPRAGGAEVYTRELTRAWAAAGHEVTLATSSAPGLLPTEEDDGVMIRRGGDWRFGVQRHARAVYRRAGGRFDLVVDEINTRPFGAPKWAKRSAVVALAHQVAREVWFAETPWPVAIAGRYVVEPWWLAGYRDVPTLTISSSSAESLRQYGIRDVSVLPVGSSFGAVASVPRCDEPTLVFCGRLCRMKRPFDAVAAVRAARARGTDVRLWIIGTGPIEDALRREAGDGIEVLGAIDDAERAARMGAAHALLITSVREGWGLVVSEAAAAGTVTIGYDVPGVRDSVRACGGFLVPPNVDALTDEIAARASSLGALRPTGHGTVPWDEVADQFFAAAGATTTGVRPSAPTGRP